MKVLLVAPTLNDIKLAGNEAADVANSGLDVKLLQGEVTSREILKEIRTGQFDVLWLATHGEKRVNTFGSVEYGIRLTDGFMPSSELVAQVRGKFSLVYLNTCTSYRIAQEIQIDAGVSVVGTLLDVPDRAAYQTGSLFAAALAEGLTPEAAYLRSMPGGERVYMYLGSLQPAASSLDLIVKRFDKLEEKISHDYAVAMKSVELSRWLLWISLGLHVPEWIALWILWSGKGN
jgi:hypothetical protein